MKVIQYWTSGANILLLVAELLGTIREPAYGMTTTGGGAMATGSSSTYTGKAHEMLPEFTGKSVDYKEYRKRLLLYEKKMELANRGSETAFNVLSSLKGRAWDACEDITMEKLESKTGMKELLTRLDSVFKYDAITELPADFEQFFVTMQRQRNESMQEYTANFERQLRRLAAHEVTLPDKVVGWFYLRRAGLTQSQRQMIMTTLTAERLSLESVRKGVNFVIGQDTTPDGNQGHGWKANRGKFNKESIYVVESETAMPYPAESYYPSSQFGSPGHGDEVYEMDDDDQDSYSYCDSDAIYYEHDDDSWAFDGPDDAASEYDAIMANYVEARSKVNQMRMSRGYYPVVAMIPENKGAGGKDKGKSKGKSSKGKTKARQAPKPPGAKSRGKAALGAQRCLRCGKAGHNADNCPVAGKRKADNMEDINMVTDVDEINLWDDDGTESEPDDTAQLDCGAASVVVGTQTLKRYLKVLMMKGFNLNDIPVWRCTKNLRFGNGNLDTTNLCALIPTYFRGMRRDVLMYIMNGATPCLLGRPVLEAFQIAINYSDKTMACGKGAEFEKACLGPKGEYVVHMAEDLQPGDQREPDQVFLPVDFDDHVHEQTTMGAILSSEDNVFALEFKDRIHPRLVQRRCEVSQRHYTLYGVWQRTDGQQGGAEERRWRQRGEVASRQAQQDDLRDDELREVGRQGAPEEPRPEQLRPTKELQGVGGLCWRRENHHDCKQETQLRCNPVLKGGWLGLRQARPSQGIPEEADP